MRARHRGAGKGAPVGVLAEGVFGMLSAALDAGGSKHDQSILVVAGFVSSVGDWIEFDKEWNRRLAQDRLPYFHAKSFAHSSVPFDEGWKKDEHRRTALSADLMGIIKGHVYRKFGSIVINDVHAAQMSDEIRARFYLEAYPLAGRTVARRVASFAVDFGARLLPEFVFEDGDLDKGLLIKRFEQDKYPTPIFRPKKDTVDRKTGLMTRAYTPLQAADWLAYELFIAYKKNAAGIDLCSFRWPYKQFDKITGEPGIYLASDIKRLNDMLIQKTQRNQIIVDPATGAHLLPHYVQ